MRDVPANFDRFLPEMVRVLRPGGHFLYADFRGFLEYDAWDAALADMPMRMVSKRVRTGCTTSSKTEAQQHQRRFAGLVGSASGPATP
jgi:ubiquinone/menaquinone biosynthesis C-methylase UbiE